MDTCSIPQCNATVATRGWCRKHYTRWLRHGDPQFVKTIVGDDARRFLAKVEPQGECWSWTAFVNPGGYGTFGSGGKRGPILLAHRWAYEHWIGPIADGYTIDHLCHNDDRACAGGVTCLHRRCVNPAHLSATATLAENVSRSPNAPENRTHCPSGHEYTEANTGYFAGRKPGQRRRYCKRCHVAREVIRQRKRRAEQATCSAGHAYSASNTIVTDRGRRCRLCAQLKQQRGAATRRARRNPKP